MKPIKTYATHLEAQLAKLALEAVGVTSTVFGIDLPMEGGASGVQLLVPDEHAAAAIQILERSAADDVGTASSYSLETLIVHQEGAVLFVEISAPPMNLLGPELVRDLVSLIRRAEADDAVQVLVFRSADPDYFIAHVDVTRIKEYRDEAAKLVGEPSIGLLFRHLSASRLVTIAQVEGRVRAAGNEFVLACDMCFAARESAIFSQPEVAFGVAPGAGGMQHLVRLIGRARAFEVMFSAGDYEAGLAETYGWINRALPAAELGDFVAALAHRIAGFPVGGRLTVKDRVNALALAPIEDFRRDSDLFGENVRKPEAQNQLQAAMKGGFQTRDTELSLARMLGELADNSRP
jgi:enoyl-CoA hydratase/carnithine racemase